MSMAQKEDEAANGGNHASHQIETSGSIVEISCNPETMTPADSQHAIIEVSEEAAIMDTAAEEPRPVCSSPAILDTERHESNTTTIVAAGAVQNRISRHKNTSSTGQWMMSLWLPRINLKPIRTKPSSKRESYPNAAPLLSPSLLPPADEFISAPSSSLNTPDDPTTQAAGATSSRDDTMQTPLAGGATSSRDDTMQTPLLPSVNLCASEALQERNQTSLMDPMHSWICYAAKDTTSPFASLGQINDADCAYYLRMKSLWFLSAYLGVTLSSSLACAHFDACQDLWMEERFLALTWGLLAILAVLLGLSLLPSTPLRNAAGLLLMLSSFSTLTMVASSSSKSLSPAVLLALASSFGSLLSLAVLSSFPAMPHADHDAFKGTGALVTSVITFIFTLMATSMAPSGTFTFGTIVVSVAGAIFLSGYLLIGLRAAILYSGPQEEEAIKVGLLTLVIPFMPMLYCLKF
ncbi:hypothetical protein CEUSTIGMA_g1661.t1 [Chlamydomonas eustigma]|uniref:Uncharacterized protein n=1 Tax=Chlamydomonas eustigma TaxID=1157962 RepID=A0A250WU99_9CHLO|nr:hypothetical protein CEUSTIGMA_g1661.t1 [Chlamydomonas eustigma]|eukprot:GAX74212.1 hypothetical protein CEUSTIGMA_g1661.t1 [Chlamydomonas eustigma]